MTAPMKALAQTTSALDAIRKGLIRCGFELEFQSVNGVSQDESGDGCPANEISAPFVEVGSDSSVRGGEVRTEGALTPQQFMSAAIALFTGHDFEIDEGCSFHIHLSVQGVRHRYGKRMQADLMAYLLENQHRLPDGVRDRLKSSAIRFCKFNIAAEKFTAVHGHSHGTWEFRLFGNVTTQHEAWKCLLLAIDALRHAYRVKEGMDKSLVSTDALLEFNTVASEALKAGRSLQKQLRADTLKELVQYTQRNHPKGTNPEKVSLEFQRQRSA